MLLNRSIVLIGVAVILSVSCSVQKRKYQKGYFVERKSASLHSAKKESSSNSDLNRASKTEQFCSDRYNSSGLEASAYNTSQANAFSFSSRAGKNLPEDSCDVIIYKNGGEVPVRLIEISALQIKYKKCDMPEGPVYISNKSELFMIKYANGTKEVMEKEQEQEKAVVYAPAPVRVNDGNQPKSPTWLATNALVFSLIGLYPLFFPASIAGLIMAIIQIKRIEAEPNKYAGLRKSRAAIIIAIIGFYLSFLAYFLLIGGGL